MGVHPRVCGEATPESRSMPARHHRVCGEAGLKPIGEWLPTGPSPRVRGSHAVAGVMAGVFGSIPACAGKPHAQALGYLTNKVHPRVCGEAISPMPKVASSLGPSPRVRGSHLRATLGPDHLGSIPACAGKPGRGTD